MSLHEQVPLQLVLIDSEQVLTDDQLRSGGLITKKVLVRTEPSKNSLRAKKQKDEKAKKGVRQVNIEVTDSHRFVAKKFAEVSRKNENATVQQLLSAVAVEFGFNSLLDNQNFTQVNIDSRALVSSFDID